MSIHPAPPSDVLLADGRVAVVRPLTAQDLPAVDRLHDRASDEALRLRFFAAGRRQAHAYVEHLSTSGSTTALVAELGGDLVGIVTAERIGADVEEVAFLVDGRVNGQGLGSLLLEHLADGAAARGVTRMTAEVLVENRGMLRVFADVGFDVVQRPDGEVVTVDLDPRTTDRFLAAADRREATAEARSLKPLLHPASVAVVGARRDGTGIGAAVLRSIVAGGFAGRVVAVHPSAESVGGVPASPTHAALGEPVDLVVVTVPAQAAVDAVRDAALAGVRAAVVISSGFEELGAHGRDLQREMVATARAHSMRLVGPNCLGLLTRDGTSTLNATFHDGVPPAGGLAIASQSGGVGIVLLDLARRMDLGVGTFVSLGNKADVSGNDLLSAWRDDPGVTAAALYLESFGNAVKFARIARDFAQHKPLLAVVGGRSTGGRRAGASHTAAAASSTVGIAALFAQAGVIGCDSAEEMAELALLLAEQPRPRGVRLGVLSNAGGMGVLAADAADDHGLTVPALSADVTAALSRHVHGTVGIANPIDVGAAAEASDLAAATAVLLDTDEVDAVLVVLVATAVKDPTEALRALNQVRESHPDTPLVLVPLGDVETEAGGGFTRLPSVTAAVRALARAARYDAWLRAPHEESPRTSPAVVADVRSAAQTVVATVGEGFIGPDTVRDLLTPYGLAPEGQVLTDVGEIRRLVDRLTTPVALKVADPRVVHKTDRGLVRVGVNSGDDAAAAVEEFARTLGVESVPVLVQPMRHGVELAVGLVRDPVFGPLVMVAAGGVATDVLDDRVFLMPPLTPRDAVRAVHGLRLWPLLDGFRGEPPVDRRALEELVVAVGRLAVEVPEVAELDLNPVLAHPGGVALVDVKVRLATCEAGSSPLLRALRAPR